MGKQRKITLVVDEDVYQELSDILLVDNKTVSQWLLENIEGEVKANHIFDNIEGVETVYDGDPLPPPEPGKFHFHFYPPVG